jgi:FlaA1/EpsC-like NDP-sugar epimerase
MLGAPFPISESALLQPDLVQRRNQDDLLARILGRSHSLFAEDVAANGRRLAEAIGGKRLLVVGAAGSVGTSFVKQVARFAPACLHLIDISENGLVEAVRDLRSSPLALALPQDFRTASLDFGGAEFARFAADHRPYDVFVNFAALKHVRAERDVYSLLRMIEVNVANLKSCLDRAAELGFARAFSVSTDKSVRPANLMGATKNLMEQVLFQRGFAPVATSARFANVAFSAGSLLEGFEQRLRKRQPLAAPTDVRRYIISEVEAGELCLLACFLGEARQVFFPKLRPETDLMSFADIAAAFLRHHGYEPRLCGSEREAIAARDLPRGQWPCHFAPTDTTGEKQVEEFFRPTDAVDETSFRAAGRTREVPADPRVVSEFLDRIQRIRAAPVWKKADVVEALRAAVPELAHRERDRNLDQKM